MWRYLKPPQSMCLEARQASSKSHRGKWFQPVENDFPPRGIISFCFPLFTVLARRALATRPTPVNTARGRRRLSVAGVPRRQMVSLCGWSWRVVLTAARLRKEHSKQARCVSPQGEGYHAHFLNVSAGGNAQGYVVRMPRVTHLLASRQAGWHCSCTAMPQRAGTWP